MDITNILSDNDLFNTQKGFSYTVRTDCRNIKLLAQLKEEYDLPDLEAEFLVVGHKQEDGKYFIEFYYGIHSYSPMHYAFGIESGVGEDRLEALIYNMLEHNLDEMFFIEDLYEILGNDYYIGQEE